MLGDRFEHPRVVLDAELVGHGQQHRVGSLHGDSAPAPRRSRPARPCSCAEPGELAVEVADRVVAIDRSAAEDARSSSVTIGSTLRLTDTRGSRHGPPPPRPRGRSRSARPAARRRHAGVLGSSVELIRFMPCSAAHCAVARVPGAPPDPLRQSLATAAGSRSARRPGRHLGSAWATRRRDRGAEQRGLRAAPGRRRSSPSAAT